MVNPGKIRHLVPLTQHGKVASNESKTLFHIESHLVTINFKGVLLEKQFWMIP